MVLDDADLIGYRKTAICFPYTGQETGFVDTTTRSEMKKRFERAAETNCGAGFQPAKKKNTQQQARMPAPQDIARESEPPITAGSCVLRRPEVAQIVQDALLYFEGQRYHLCAWCVMPNHVHVVVQPLPGHKLENILHSWKSFTANKINRILDRQGALWERESSNHLIRRTEHVEGFIHYTELNPVAAALCAIPKDWPFSSCGAGFQPAPIEFIAPSETPFVEPRTRGELPHLHKEGGTYFITWRLLDAVVLKHKNSSDAGCLPSHS